MSTLSTARLAPFCLMWAAFACGALGCGPSTGPPRDAGAADARLPDAGPPFGPYPLVEALPERAELPALFESFDGTRRADDVAAWESWRRAELQDLFAFYLYGYAPDDVIAVSVEVVASEPDFVPGRVRYEELALTLGTLGLTVHVALFSPLGVDPPPVFIAPNRCGNQEVSTDPRIRATTAWQAEDCGASVEASRGVRASHWPIEAIVDAGYALAAFHESELDPDDEAHDFANGVHAALRDEARDPRLRWGRIAAWAWGISRVIDGLDARVNGERIAVVGHSRRGKTALLAGALDARIDLVIAHQSGTGGAALHRSLAGESVRVINAAFPSWFNDIFPTFSDEEPRLPIDQHMLIALAAPRAVLVTDGDADAWADPAGARAAVEAASPAWELHGLPGLVTDAEGEPTLDGRLSWQSRPGDHALTHADWDVFLAFAARRWID